MERTRLGRTGLNVSFLGTASLGAGGLDNNFRYGQLNVSAAYRWTAADRLPRRIYLPLACQA